MTIARPARDADEETILTYLHMELGVPVPHLQNELAAFQRGHEVGPWACKHGVARHWCRECNPGQDAVALARGAAIVRPARKQGRSR